MRIAALYDIHGNVDALAAVLKEVHGCGAQQIMVGGDVFPGPFPVETLRLLLSVGIPTAFIHGNGDREVLARISGVETDWYRAAPEKWREPVRWTAEQLGSDYQSTLANWPPTWQIEVPAIGKVLFCHATPRNDTDIFSQATPEERLLGLFHDLGADTVVCGHTHIQFDRRVGTTRVVNAGSVGMPFGKPGADWLLLGSDIELRHTDYDLARAANRVRRTHYPKADEFAARSILEPPSVEEMVAMYGRAELK